MEYWKHNVEIRSIIHSREFISCDNQFGKIQIENINLYKWESVSKQFWNLWILLRLTGLILYPLISYIIAIFIVCRVNRLAGWESARIKSYQSAWSPTNSNKFLRGLNYWQSFILGRKKIHTLMSPARLTCQKMCIAISNCGKCRWVERSTGLENGLLLVRVRLSTPLSSISRSVHFLLLLSWSCIHNTPRPASQTSSSNRSYTTTFLSIPALNVA